jgi:hypothetical protein
MGLSRSDRSPVTVHIAAAVIVRPQFPQAGVKN